MAEQESMDTDQQSPQTPPETQEPETQLAAEETDGRQPTRRAAAVIQERQQEIKRSTNTRILSIVLGVLVVAGVGFLLLNAMPAPTTTTVAPMVQQVPISGSPITQPSTPWWSFLANAQLPYLGKMSNKLDWRLMLAILQPLLAVSAVAVVVLFIYASNTRRKYIEFDKIGILISDSRVRGEGNARFIPWGCLEAVQTVYPKQKEADNIAKSEAVSEILGNPNDCIIVFYVDDKSVVKVPWKDIITCCEPGAFINALKTWAPEIGETCHFPGQTGIDKIDTTTYTQLWFKYYSTGSDRKRTNMLEKGEKLCEGRYEVAGQLGGGGQGTAYLAVDHNADASGPSEVVLKEYILPVHRGQQVLQTTVEKLRAEATILAKINHPNIVKMMGEFIEDHRGYLIMEYVNGRSLKTLVAQEGPQPEKLVRELAVQICDVLAYLHSMTPPVVHRDLTPDNLILQDDGIVKLVDFNVAHQLESAATATVVGKHCYIPPEQFRGKPTPQSDIYAFGGTLYYLLTGEEPEPLTLSRPREKNPAVSEHMNEIVAFCTSLDAAKRFSNIAEVRNALLEEAVTDDGAVIKINDKVKA